MLVGALGCNLAWGLIDGIFYLMGRFAVRYKALFGESPSQTLQRPPEKGDRYLLHPADPGLP